MEDWKMEDGEGKSPGDAMSELPSAILHSPSSLAAQRMPAPRCGAISVLPGTMADFEFMDELQRLHQKMLGFLPRGTIHGKLAAGHVLIAETTNAPRRHGGTEARPELERASVSPFL